MPAALSDPVRGSGAAREADSAHDAAGGRPRRREEAEGAALLPKLPPELGFIQRGVLHSNSIVVHGPTSFTLIDTGYATGVEALAASIGRVAGRKLSELSRIINTHAHPDHTGGNAYLRERSGCDIWMSDIDAKLVESDDQVTLMREFADMTCPSFAVTRSVAPGDVIDLGGFDFAVIDGSGHAAGEVAFYCEKLRLVLCGDLLWKEGFSNVIPLVEGVGGLARHERSLARLRGLDIEIALPGHGPPILGRASVLASIDASIATVRFFRQNQPRWAEAALKGFLVMHVLISGPTPRASFIERCERSRWFREHQARFFADRPDILRVLVDKLVEKGLMIASRSGELTSPVQA